MSRWPQFDDEQIEAVSAVLRSGKVNAWTGHDVRDFEAAYCAYTGAKHAIALANGSVSIELALKALDLQPGDEVIVTPRSFLASASSVLLEGGVPVFADVDRDSQNITAETIVPLIGPRTKGIIPVHLAGWPCDMTALRDMAKAHDLWIIEDCAQAHGAMIGGTHVGRFGDVGSFSFCQDKIITTGGEGGLIVTDNSELWSKMWSAKDHGKDYGEVHRQDHPPGFRWLHQHLGTNLRMTGISAILGRIQLGRLDEMRAHRTANAMILAEACATCPTLRTPLPGPDMTHAFYRFYTFVRPDQLAPGWSRDRIIAEITEAGFPAFSGSCPEMYLERVFKDRGIGPEKRLPVAKELGETSLAFLVDPTWSSDDMRRLAACIVSVTTRATA